MDILEIVRAKGRCCITDKPLKDSAHINMIELDFNASWEFPTAGNVIYGITGRAVAIVHDDCFLEGKMQGKIKYAVEFNKDEIIYHPVLEIKYCRVCGCHQLDACFHPEYGNCFWVEEDLCSHCKNIPGQAKRYSVLMRELNINYYNSHESMHALLEIKTFYKKKDITEYKN